MSIDAIEAHYIERLHQERRRPRVLADGDSWFSPSLPRNLVRYIDWLGSYHILNVASPGGEPTSMLGGAQKARLRNLLDDDSIGFDLILFSAGGHDIVGEALLGFLDHMPAGGVWQDAVNEQRLERRLAGIANRYHELMDLRDDYRPAADVLVHGYDFPVPGDRPKRLGALPISGPWILPYLLHRGVVRATDQRAVTRYLMERLDATVQEVARARRGFVYVRTQGTLDPSEWDDEIHPTPAGFERLAELFRPHLGGRFPQHTR